MTNTLIFLGTGASAGIPVIGCRCVVCRSPSLFNCRLRPSALIRIGKQQFLIDVGPDFRLQALRHGIVTLDGILLTHAHYDHVAGLDDLRPIYYQRQTQLPILLSAETAQDIQHRYSYLFSVDKERGHIPRFRLQLLPDQVGQCLFEGISIGYMTYIQAHMPVNGYRFGELAYLSDIRHFTPDIFEHLKGVKKLVISALRHQPSSLHFSVDEAVNFARQVGVELAWLTHLSHDLDHIKTNDYLPSNIQLAYDGLEIEFN
jgi:phosphoribosyl 1,2-cyclic phosphate phosphodiesterase